MIVLDTNVVSELTRPEPEGRVDAWLDSQRSADLYLTTISEAELRYGLVIMNPGNPSLDLGRHKWIVQA